MRDKLFIEVNAAQLRASDLVIFFHTISQRSVSVQCVCCGTRRVAQTATAAAAALVSCEIALIIICLRSALNMWSIARISPHTMQKHSKRRYAVQDLHNVHRIVLIDIAKSAKCDS